MDEYNCEVLIIGAGPAGLSAAIYCGRAGRDTIVLEGKQVSALERAKEVGNYPGFKNIGGLELLSIFKNQVKAFDNVKFIEGDVIALMIGMGSNLISTRTSNITADSVIIATGTGQRKEKIKGEEALMGHGISYCALCDGPLYRDLDVIVYGTDEEALEDALILDQMGCKVKLVADKSVDELPNKINEFKSEEIEIYDNFEIIEVISNKEGNISKVVCKSTNPDLPNEIKTFEINCLFILTHIPSNSIFKKAGVELDDRKNIKIDSEQQTSVKGVFAAGDVTGGLYQVVFATAEGARAGIHANKYVRQLKKD